MLECHLGAVAYRLELPNSMHTIHLVFHVSKLANCCTHGQYQPPPPPIELEGELKYEFEKTLAKGHGKLVDVAVLNILYIGMAMNTHTIVGNPYVIYSITKTISMCMRTLVGLCLTLVDVKQRVDVCTNRCLDCVLQTLCL